MSGATSFFTDIVDSTERAVELGDSRWAELLERHNAVVRAELARFDGKEMDTSGDGFFAIFPDAAHAIDAGNSIRADLRTLDLKVRIGIHVGDCWMVDDKCTGLAIHIGARIAALARPDEILLSEAAREEAGPTYDFTDHGETNLKGVPGRWHLYAVAAGPNHSGVGERPELQRNGHWRMAVWALRVGYLGLVVALVGVMRWCSVLRRGSWQAA
jgi:class 3 adenylate cyclase